jgi:heme A synthase
MRTKLNLLHRTIGIITVVIFVGTGALMRFHYSRIYESNYLVRMMFRSIHIYILLAGLLNIAIGIYMVVSSETRKRNAQLFGSVCLLIAPAVLIGAFFYEPALASLERHVTQAGIILLLVGTLSHLAASRARAA